MIIPVRIETVRRFRFLWLKSVRGFRSDVHCAKCLIGEYHPGLSSSGMSAGEVAVLEVDLSKAPVHYLCGVTGKWENNLHVAFEADLGADPLTIESWGVVVTFPAGGVRRIPIMAPLENVDPAFGTCRNWLFGLQHFEGYLPSANADRNALMASASRP